MANNIFKYKKYRQNLIDIGHGDMAYIFTIKYRLFILWIKFLRFRYQKRTIWFKSLNGYTLYYKFFAPTGLDYKRQPIYFKFKFNIFKEDSLHQFIPHSPHLEFEIYIFKWSIGFGIYKEHLGWSHESITFDNANNKKKYNFSKIINNLNNK